MQAPHLFTPLTLRDVTFKNRIVISPMCQYTSNDGFANDWHLVHLGSRAIGGAALIFTEAAAVTPQGRISPQDLGIWSDAHIDFLKQITSFIKAHHAVPGIQLAHAGRKASTKRPWEGAGTVSIADGGWQTVAPSAIPFAEHDPLPRVLTIEDIENIVQAFIAGAKRALLAGFDVIEIHSAHGYLIHEFLSPLSNHRSDEYGGSFINRTRLLVTIAKALRQIIPDGLPLFVRLSCTDWVKDGWSIADSIAVSKLLRAEGVDLIDASSGGNVPHAAIPVGPGYQVPFADQIRHEAKVHVGAVGLITDPLQANEIINTKKADLVLIARESLRDPYWPLHAANQLQAEVEWPVQYLRAALPKKPVALKNAK